MLPIISTKLRVLDVFRSYTQVTAAVLEGEKYSITNKRRMNIEVP